MKYPTELLSNAVIFLGRQHRDWRVTVVRTSLDKFAYQMIFPYLSIYIVALGASVTELGLVNSLGMIAGGVTGPLTGWLIDRSGPKKVYLVGIGLLAVSYFTYGIADGWHITIVAMISYWLGYAVSIHSCATVCGNSLTNEDRATGMTICETVAAGILGMAGPMIGAWLVTTFGGISVEGIRPVFFVGLATTLSTFAIILTQLSGGRVMACKPTGLNMLGDFREVLKGGSNLRRWLAIASVNQLPLAMVFPFSQVFAHEVKGADPFTLGAMVTGSALTSILFAIPLGRLADTRGRKKALCITIPLFWLSNLILIGARGRLPLLIAGVLQGFYFITTPITGAMERELVPPEHMGKWLGMTRPSRMLVNALMAGVAGIVWDKVGPHYVFLAYVGIDLLLRMPLLLSMPETLRLKIGRNGQRSF